jgi:hypothetical protein
LLVLVLEMVLEMVLLDVDGELGIDSDTDIHILLDSDIDIAIALPAFHRTEPVRHQAVHGLVVPLETGRDDLLRELAAWPRGGGADGGRMPIQTGRLAVGVQGGQDGCEGGVLEVA